MNHVEAGHSLPLIILLCATLVIGGGCGRHEKIDSQPFTALGEVMASATAQLAGGKGTAVLVVGKADASQPNPFDQTVAAFRKTLQADGLQITATETVECPAVLMSGTAPFSTQKFQELLEKDASCDVLVSFIGVPILTPDQMAQLPSPRPKVVSVVTYNPPAPALFAGKVVYLAALPKTGSDQSPPASASAQEWFDARYQLVTPETAGSLLH